MIEVAIHERIGLLASQGALERFKGFDAMFPELPDPERHALSAHLRDLEGAGESIPASLWVEGPVVRDGSGREHQYPLPSPPITPAPGPIPFDPYKARL